MDTLTKREAPQPAQSAQGDQASTIERLTKQVAALQNEVDRRKTVDQDFETIKRHDIVVRGHVEGHEPDNKTDTYLLTVVEYGAADDALRYACIPEDPEQAKRRIARNRRLKKAGKPEPLVVIGRVDAIFHEKRLLVLLDCLIFDSTDFR